MTTSNARSSASRRASRRRTWSGTSNASAAEASRLWRALGFADAGGAAAFTQADAEAVSMLLEVVASGMLDFDMAVRLTRAVGHTMARLADWQVSTLSERVEAAGARRARAPARG